MSWSKEWINSIIIGPNTSEVEVSSDLLKEWPISPAEDAFVKTGIDIAANAFINLIPKEHNNKVPTHDPYTNPDSHLYYECSCGAILDPGTKSFAGLNNAASKAGWKVRWGERHYTPYCFKCGEEVE